MKNLGLSKCWLNHKDGTETIYSCNGEYKRDGYRTIGHKNGQWCGEKYDLERDGEVLHCVCNRKKGHADGHGTPTAEDLVSVDD